MKGGGVKGLKDGVALALKGRGKCDFELKGKEKSSVKMDPQFPVFCIGLNRTVYGSFDLKKIHEMT